MKPVKPDAALAAVVGREPRSRPEITKSVWAYIKEHELQDTKDRRQIRPDDRLGRVCAGKKRVSMFELTRLINEHVQAD